MEPLHVTLLLSIIFCSLVAGLLFGFAIVVMPGIANLSDKEYLIGVQLPTFRFNIPLNNELQNLDIEELEETQAKSSRTKFETSWNRWNRIRTINGIIAVSMFLLLLYFL